MKILCANPAHTEIPAGDVSGTWTKANSPYYINGEITIPNDSTLTIEPGVEVIFTGHYVFFVKGRLLAIGTEQDTILSLYRQQEFKIPTRREVAGE